MNAKQLVIVSVIAVAAGAAVAPVAFAADGSSLTRAEVSASVLQARANGTLRRTGDAADYDVRDVAAGPARTRAEVRAEVLDARASHLLVASGEAPVPIGAGMASEPTYLARATVKEETRTARRNGELIPSGEGFGPTETVAHARHQPGVAFLGVSRGWR
jgi:hypothetical protein